MRSSFDPGHLLRTSSLTQLGGPRTRREFLQLAAACGVGVLGASWAQAARPRAGRVIVIGAGMAGLGAARTLVDQHGFSAPGQVILLEGRDRIGGRIHTSRTLTTPVELGAAWIHGSRGNPITAIAEAGHIATNKTDYGSISVFGQDGHEFSGDAYDRVEDDNWEPTLKGAIKWVEDRDADPSLAAALSAAQFGAGLQDCTEVSQGLLGSR